MRFYGLRQANSHLGPLITMELELLEGASLDSQVRAGLSVATAIDWVCQAAEGVAAAHALGIVHRDLKPENLYLTRAGVVKVLDFGIARAFDDTQRQTQITMAGVVPGTPGYMAPELCNGAMPTAAADVYALGMVLFELLLGRHPLQEPGATRLNGLHLMFAQLQRTIPRIDTLRGDVPSTVATVIEAALAKNPSQRLADAGAFLAALRHGWVAGVPVATPSAPPPSSQTTVLETEAVVAGYPITASTIATQPPPSPAPHATPGAGEATPHPHGSDATRFALPIIPAPGTFPGASTPPPPQGATIFQLPVRSQGAASAEFRSGVAGAATTASETSDVSNALPRPSLHPYWGVVALLGCAALAIAGYVKYKRPPSVDVNARLEERKRLFAPPQEFVVVGTFSGSLAANQLRRVEVPLSVGRCYRIVGAGDGELHLILVTLNPQNGTQLREWHESADQPVIGVGRPLCPTAPSRGELQVFGWNSRRYKVELLEGSSH